MEIKTYKAIVIATNQEITVYKLRSGKWCDYSNEDTYETHELKFLNQ